MQLKELVKAFFYFDHVQNYLQIEENLKRVDY